MYSTTSFIDYEVYEKVDVTELAWEQRQHQGIAMESLPAAAKRVKQWVKKRLSKKDFTKFYLSKLQSFFLCHQIEQVPLPQRRVQSCISNSSFPLVSYSSFQAQHDASQIFIQLVTSACFITTFLSDFKENYGHIA